MNVQHRRRAMFRNGLLGLFLVAAVAATPARSFTPGLLYRVRVVITPPSMPGMPSDGPMVIVGHGVAVGARTRFEFDTVPPIVQSSGGMAVGDFMLTLDSGQVMMVSPGTKTYTEGLPGIGALPPDLLASASFTNVSVNVENLGVGDTIQGYPTKRFRTTTKYTLGIMGQSLENSTVQEFWTAELGATIATPFDGNLPASLANGPMKELMEKMTAARLSISGVAIRTTTTTSMTGPMSMTTTQALEMLDIKQGDVDESLLAIPVGFTKKP